MSGIHDIRASEPTASAPTSLQMRLAQRVSYWRVRLARAVHRAELRHYAWADRRFSLFERLRPTRQRARKLHRAHDLLASLAYGCVEIGILGFGALIGRSIGAGKAPDPPDAQESVAVRQKKQGKRHE